MSKAILYSIFLNLFLNLIMVQGMAAGLKDSATHKDPDAKYCNECHGKEEFIIKDTIKVCLKCHPNSTKTDHPVGVIPKMKTELPLTENKMSCITCHEPHGKSGLPKLLRKATNDLCFDCHNK